MSKKNISSHDQDWSRMIRKLAAGKPLPKEFTFVELANICHRSGLFLWMLQGRIGYSLSKGDYIELTPQSASRFGMFLAGKSGRCSWIDGLGILRFSKIGEGRGKRYRLEAGNRDTFFSAGRLIYMAGGMIVGPGQVPPLTPAPTPPAPQPPAPVIAKLCVSEDNKIVSLGKLTFAGAKALEAWAKDQVKELRPPAEINASLDIETWGTQARSAISAIGAVKFTAKGIVGQSFYMRVDIKSCIDAGLTLDAETMVWWMKQDDAARQEVCKAGVSLRCALEALAWWLCDGNGKDINVWGNGWDFDGGRLGDAYAAARMRLPWDYWQGRDLRTLEAEHPEVKDEPEGVAHNALDDARVQARKVIRLWEAKAAPLMAVKAA